MNRQEVPISIEAEQSVIGGVMLKNAAYWEISDLLTEQDFYLHANRAIWRVITTLAAQSQPFDILTINQQLESSGLANTIEGCFAYLAEISSGTPSAANVKAYAGIVKQRSAQRNLIAKANDILNLAKNPDGKTLPEIVSEAQESVLSLNPTTGSKDTEIELGEAAAGFFEDIQAASSGQTIGLITGIAGIDRYVQGIKPEDLVVIGGAPGAAKSLLSNEIMVNICDGQKKSILLFNMEMGPKEVFRRRMSKLAELMPRQMKQPTSQDYSLMQTIYHNEIKTNPCKWITDTRKAVTLAQVVSTAKRVKAQNPDLALIVVDYLQIAGICTNSNRRDLKVSEFVQGLKNLAGELKTPVLLLSQINRTSKANGQTRRPTIYDLKDGGVEQAPDLILLLNKEDTMQDVDHVVPCVEVIRAKVRDDPEAKGVFYAEIVPGGVREITKDDYDARQQAASIKPYSDMYEGSKAKAY